NLVPCPRSTVLSPSGAGSASALADAAATGGAAPALGGGVSGSCPVSRSAWSYSSWVMIPFFNKSFRAGSAAPAGIATPRSQAVTTRAEIVERRMVLSPLLPNLVNLYPKKYSPQGSRTGIVPSLPSAGVVGVFPPLSPSPFTPSDRRAADLHFVKKTYKR